MENSIQNNLLRDHLCNGFRISSCPVFKPGFSGQKFGYIFTIMPNRSDFKFCFLHLQDAYDFCNRFKNCHSADFWFRVWKSFPLYHFSRLVEIVKPNDYLL